MCDYDSTYGTYINNLKLTPNIEIKIEDDSEIKFGIKSSIFR